MRRAGPGDRCGHRYGHVMDIGIVGRRAAVAAGSSGLGLGAARALAAEGAAVVICGRDADRLDRAIAEIGHGAVSVVCDVGSAEGGAEFVELARVALGGPIDILIPNAGGPPAGTFTSTDVDAYSAALDLNLLSIVAMCKAAVPGMQERGWGRVAAITSLSVRQPIPNIILSNTARAGATAFLKTLALEVAADGVTVNTVQPGIHDTPRLDALFTAEQKAQVRMGDAGDFGSVVAFLCSEQAKFVTGLQMHVDGGAYAGLL
jgi:3-oxoacyl-[acyl-carrier protein] reductase